jgi:hypothetical protein
VRQRPYANLQHYCSVTPLDDKNASLAATTTTGFAAVVAADVGEDVVKLFYCLLFYSP